MKYFFIFAIVLYQHIFSVFIKTILGSQATCRFSPTCSEYAKISIQKHGVLKGCYLSILRILSCQPFSYKSQKHYV